MATTIDDGLSSGREGLSEGEIKPQKLKRMKNHLGLAFSRCHISIYDIVNTVCRLYLLVFS